MIVFSLLIGSADLHLIFCLLQFDSFSPVSQVVQSSLQDPLFAFTGGVLQSRWGPCETINYTNSAGGAIPRADDLLLFKWTLNSTGLLPDGPYYPPS